MCVSGVRNVSFSFFNFKKKSFGPKTCNCGTLKPLLKKEIEYIQTVFHYQNNYYFWVIGKINEVKQKTKTTTVINNKAVSETHRLVLSYKGNKGTDSQGTSSQFNIKDKKTLKDTSMMWYIM